MTRINIATHARLLTDEHLLAEHREIKRLPFVFKKRLDIKKFNDIPKNFTLGTGHVLFFINKGFYTKCRYEHLHEECLNRGFSVSDYSENWKIYENTPYWNEAYFPNDNDKNIIRERIIDKIKNSTKSNWHYYGKSITPDDAIKLINDNLKQ